VSNVLWAIWLVALILLPLGGYGIYTSLVDAPDAWPLVREHRLLIGIAGGALALGALWVLWHVLRLATRTQRRVDAATADLPGNAEQMRICKRCGPFAADQLVVTPAPRARIRTMRAMSLVLLAATCASIVLYWNDRISGAFSSVAAVFALVGLNMWRLSREPTEKCPTCGATTTVDGRTARGKYLFQKWQMEHRTDQQA
jgi:hypothetical protein